MKHLSTISRLFYLLFFLFLFAQMACTEKECPKGCENGGTCENGICNCPEGYAGVSCEVKVNPCFALGCDTLHSTCNTSGSTPFCVCDEGWEGEDCSQTWVDKYLGTYNASETCDGTSNNFIIEALYAPKQNAFTLKYFHNALSAGVPAKIVADLSSTNNFIITPQPMSFGTVSGSGEYYTSNRSMLIYFTIIPLGTTDTTRCELTLNRQ